MTDDETSARVLEIRKRILEGMNEDERARFARRLAGEEEPSVVPNRNLFTRVREFFWALWAIAFFVALFVGAGWLIGFWTHW